MLVHDIQVTRPNPKRARLQAQVSYDRHSKEEIYWLDVPEMMADQLSLTGNPWLVALLPIAATFGERLRIDAPVDSTLLQGVRDVLRIWNSWDMGLHTPDLEVEEAFDQAGHSLSTHDDRLRGGFFSAGVDSIFTALELPQSGDTLDELIFIAGFDRYLEDTRALEVATQNIAHAANELGLPAHTVSTNLRRTLWGDTSWSFLSHGSAAAFIALALEPRFHQMYLAASVDSIEYDTDMPWGSHPDVDHLFSSNGMELIHHGSDTGRLDKVRAIAAQPVVQKYLCVCYQSADGRNCGHCKKCLFAAAMLDVLGLYEQATCLDTDPSYIDRLQGLRVGDPGDIGQLYEVRDAATAAGNTRLANAASVAVTRSLRPWHRAHYQAKRRLMLWAPHIRDRLRRLHLKGFASDPQPQN